MTHVIVHLNLTRRNVHYVRLKMKHEEEVTRNLCKLEGRRTSPSYSNDMKCAALQRTLNKCATEWAECRMGNSRAFTSAREILVENLFLAQKKTWQEGVSERMPGRHQRRQVQQTNDFTDGNWIEKGRLVHMTNSSLNTPHACTCTVNRLWRGTNKSGKFDGCWWSQSDASTLESMHAPQAVTNS